MGKKQTRHRVNFRGYIEGFWARKNGHNETCISRPRAQEEKDLESEAWARPSFVSRPHFHTTTNTKLAGRKEGTKGRRRCFPPSLPFLLLLLLFAFFFLFRLSEPKEGKKGRREGKAKRVNLRELEKRLSILRSPIFEVELSLQLLETDLQRWKKGSKEVPQPVTRTRVNSSTFWGDPPSE